jgi:hypothetical protein
MGSVEFRRAARGVREKERRRWDEQLDRDSASGQLGLLFEEAERESDGELLGEWPAAK